MKKRNLLSVTILAAGLLACGQQVSETKVMAISNIAPGAPGDTP